MPKYTRKAQTVNAEEWQPGRQVEGVIQGLGEGPFGEAPDQWGWVVAKDGRRLHVRPGDMIVTEEDGTRYAMRPEEFHAKHVGPLRESKRKAKAGAP